MGVTYIDPGTDLPARHAKKTQYRWAAFIRRANQEEQVSASDVAKEFAGVRILRGQKEVRR